jgi:hypothetical protein
MRTGVKGMLPLGCLPLWGREGVTLIMFWCVNWIPNKLGQCKTKKRI